MLMISSTDAGHAGPYPPDGHARAEALDLLSGFRADFHGCLAGYADTLFELADALLCTPGPVASLPELTLAPELRRGHGGLYKALNKGKLDIVSFQAALAGLPPPRIGGRLVLAVDVSPWLRPDAPTSGERLFCHTYGRSRKHAQMIPGWPYSFVAALEQGASSWVSLLDAARLGPGDDPTEVTARQLRDLVGRLEAAGHQKAGDPDVLVVADAGYDVTRLAFLLADLPVELCGRIRSDRKFRRPAPPRPPGTDGAPARHGPVFKCDKPDTHPAPDVATGTQTTRYGTAAAACWDRLHPQLTHRAAWEHHEGELPIVEGTAVRLVVERLPGDRTPDPIWLWSSAVGVDAAHLDRVWQAYLRRFDIEHTFRLFKQTLGWTKPKVRSPEAADLWTWLVVAAHTQLRLARDLAADLRRPWERKARTGRLTPARVRRGFRNIRPTAGLPAGAPKPSRPGPGRPAGKPNARRAAHHPVGKNIKTGEVPEAGEKQAGSGRPGESHPQAPTERNVTVSRHSALLI
jgi:hypothetical protein